MDAQLFRSLSPKHRALVAIAVLLDGREASVFLEGDALHGDRLRKAALELSDLEPELRMPFVGTMLRGALREIGS